MPTLSKPKEKSLSLKWWEVNAVLSGGKTQFRAPLKKQPSEGFVNIRVHERFRGKADRWFFETEVVKSPVNGGTLSKWSSTADGVECPYGGKGDRIWVREPWGVESHGGHMGSTGYGSWNYEVYYKAGGKPVDLTFDGHHRDDPYCRLYDSQVGEFRSATQMPRWASRVLLEVTDVRLERLQAMTEDDLLYRECYDSFAGFRKDWDTKHAAKGLGWGADPFVWVVSFKVVEAKV